MYIIPVFIPHKGCPHNCVFCNQKKITGVDNNDINSDKVSEIIDKYLSIMKKHNHIEVAFYGGSFTALPVEYQKELLKTAYKYILKGLVSSIRLSTRPDYIDDNILELLKEYGVKTIELGVQSMDNQVLNLSGRGHTDNDVIAASKLIKEHGFLLGHQIMPGLPGDNRKKIMETANKILVIKPDIIRIYPTIVIKGTNLEELFVKGLYKPLELEEAVEICADLYSLFSSKGINVIRIGLQATDEINSGVNIVAGPFHPSFGMMVKSRIFLNKIEKKLSEFNNLSPVVTIFANPKSISEIKGLNKKNIFYLKEKYRFDSIYVRQNKELQREDIRLFNGEAY